MEKVEFIKITNTQEKYLRELLVKQLYGTNIELVGTFTRKRIVAPYQYDGRATNSILKMVGLGGLGNIEETGNYYRKKVVFNIYDVLTKLKNGRQIIDDVMTELPLYSV